MDSGRSASAVATELRTSVPRVARAARRLGFASGPGGRLALDSEQVARLRDQLGVVPDVPGFTRSEVKALAALARSPLGLPSVRAVARRAGLSPTAASRAVNGLEERGLVRREPTVIAAGRARRVTVLHANRRSEQWAELAPLLARVRPPHRTQHEQRVPARLGHLFWNTAPEQLDVERGGAYIARRLLRTLDPDGLAWGALNLSAAAWREGAKARGLSADTRALAENLARAKEA
jgi:DNA-binding MarR family transcriptional regulator